MATFDRDLLNSLGGGFFAEVFTAPMSTVKTLYQSQPRIGTVSTYKLITDRWNTMGIRGFYTGGTAGITRQMLSTATKYSFYKASKRYGDHKDKQIWYNLVHGAVGGVCSSFFCQPADVCRNFLQRKEPILPAIRESPTVLYRGFSFCLIRSILSSTLTFPVYDYYKTLLGDDSNWQWAAKPGAAITATTIIHPIDLMMTRRMSKQPVFMGWNPIIYFRSISHNMIRTIPHFWIGMIAIEQLGKLEI